MIQKLNELLARTAGLDLRRGGQLERLHEVVRGEAAARGLEEDQYLDRILAAPPIELPPLINQLTNGFSWFYRDLNQMGLLEQLIRTVPALGRPLEIWVAACSNGEEVFTTGLLAAQAGRPVRILGTDINSAALKAADKAVYSEWAVRELPKPLRSRLEHKRGTYRVPEDIRAVTRFEQHNLLEVPPRPVGRPGWDLILCRNVLIYFTESAAGQVHRLLLSALAPEGHLLLGAADLIHRAPKGVALPRPQQRTPPPSAPPRPLPPAITPEEGVPHLMLVASAALEAGDLARAKTGFMKVLAQASRSGEAHLGLGIARHLAGESTAAVESLSLALKVSPDLWVAHYFLALSLANLGRHEDARREYQVATQAGRRQTRSHPDSQLLSRYDRFRADILALCERRGQLSA